MDYETTLIEMLQKQDEMLREIRGMKNIIEKMREYITRMGEKNE